MGRLDAIYARLPISLQQAAATTYGLYRYWIRSGPGFSRMVREYTAREEMTAADFESWQHEQLLRVLRIAASAVPYYRTMWSSSERAAALAGRLEDMPLLEKQPIRDDPDAFVRERHGHVRLLRFATSGSTGTPIRSVVSVQEYRDSRAVREARSLRWAGVSYRLPRATFSGRIVVPDPMSSGPFHRFNRVDRQPYLSAFHVRPDTAAAYVDALRACRTQWLTGYAVSFYLLAGFILDQRLTVPPLRAVVTTSEKLTPRMRAVMEEAYGCRVYEEYGTVENAVFASECERGSLHVSSDVSLVEILRSDGSSCGPGEAGEVVTTPLGRLVQPLIRFRLGDMAVWSPDPCPCGRRLPVIEEVVGRIEDVVIGPDGRRLVRFHGIFVELTHVREGQIVQEAIDRLRVRVVPTVGWGQADVDEIVSRVRQRLGPRVNVIVETLERIPRTRAGKFQPVVSMLREQGVTDSERTGLAE